MRAIAATKPVPIAITSSSSPTTPSSASVSSHSEWASRTNSGSEACSIHQDWYEPAPRPNTGLVSHSSTAEVHSCHRPLPVELIRCERVKSPSTSPTSGPDGFLKVSNLSTGSYAATPTASTAIAPSAIPALAARRQLQAELPARVPAPGPVQTRAGEAEQDHQQRRALALAGGLRRAQRAVHERVAGQHPLDRQRRAAARDRGRDDRREPAGGQRAEDDHADGGRHVSAPRGGQVDRARHRRDRHQRKCPQPGRPLCDGRAQQQRKGKPGQDREAVPVVDRVVQAGTDREEGRRSRPAPRRRRRGGSRARAGPRRRCRARCRPQPRPPCAA